MEFDFEFPRSLVVRHWTPLEAGGLLMGEHVHFTEKGEPRGNIIVNGLGGPSLAVQWGSGWHDDTEAGAQ